jgi:hypothetical protein
LEKLRSTIGVFAGISNEEGKLLTEKITQGDFLGDWDLPGGAIYTEQAKKASDERIIGLALSKRVEAETGLYIYDKVQSMPAMYPTVLEGGSDIVFAIIIKGVTEKPIRSETRFISVDELVSLADAEQGSRLVSGRKRMFRMCLRMFASRDWPNLEYRRQASNILKTLHD